MSRRSSLFALLVHVLIGGGAAAAVADTNPTLASLIAVYALAGMGLVVWVFRDRAGASAYLDDAVQDLRERIEVAADRRLAMRERAETAGRFREEFVAAVRHELKTPLNAILGFTEILLQEVDGPLSPQQREDIDAIQSAGVYLRELIEAVLSEWAPVDQTPTSLARIDVAALFADVSVLVKGQLVTRPVELVTQPVEPGLSVIGEPRRMRQIFINLVTNAIRATEAGQVTLSAERVPDRLEPPMVRLSVADTGRGIAPDDLPTLFQEFSQVGASETFDGGSGLGLALTRDMVEWHEGRIIADSTLGVGTTFHIELPGVRT